jgi:hypothetical protein
MRLGLRDLLGLVFGAFVVGWVISPLPEQSADDRGGCMGAAGWPMAAIFAARVNLDTSASGISDKTLHSWTTCSVPASARLRAQSGAASP